MEYDYGEVETLPLSEALGREVICDDGIRRTVRNICHSVQHKDRVIINEGDEEDSTGYFIHMLLLTCQLMGYALPSEEQKRAFSRMCRSLGWREEKKQWRLSEKGLLMWN